MNYPELNIEPAITVLMPVYNAEKTLQASIDSVLAQTYENFEFLIIDDASEDKTADILSTQTDPRIRIIRNGRNLRLAETLNIGLKQARGHFIARMDADDLALPDRLAVQIEYLESHPEISVCGSAYRLMESEIIVRPPERHEAIVATAFFTNPIAHPSAMIRFSTLIDYSIEYEREYERSEDYRLWWRLSKVSRLANLNKVLLIYRESEEQVSKKHFEEQVSVSARIRREILYEVLSSADANDHKSHEHLCLGVFNRDKKIIGQSYDWLEKLILENHRSGVFNSEELENMFCLYYKRLLYRSANLGVRALGCLWRYSRKRIGNRKIMRSYEGLHLLLVTIFQELKKLIAR